MHQAEKPRGSDEQEPYVRAGMLYRAFTEESFFESKDKRKGRLERLLYAVFSRSGGDEAEKIGKILGHQEFNPTRLELSDAVAEIRDDYTALAGIQINKLCPPVGVSLIPLEEVQSALSRLSRMEAHADRETKLDVTKEAKSDLESYRNLARGKAAVIDEVAIYRYASVQLVTSNASSFTRGFKEASGPARVANVAGLSSSIGYGGRPPSGSVVSRPAGAQQFPASSSQSLR
ncbi:hypothetical protein [Micromonospora sp. NPDC050695]|uniref:hypothetical protein n=1 Tax=Micromonospora sp. NPDC050695 TaxID=3154938 RepID=UPI003400A5E9